MRIFCVLVNFQRIVKPMFELNFVKSISERDIDLLILEELSVSVEFQEWFASRICGEKVFKGSLGAWHSVNDSTHGETDILYIFESVDGSRIAILVEDKIDAEPQHQQGERYYLRGQAGEKEGYWDSFKTCVIAPSKYLQSTKNSESYDVEITYEELLSYFQSRCSRDIRFDYKASIIIEAIQKNRRGYQPVFDERISQFVKDYYDFTEKNYPNLKMQKSKPRPTGSTWISFYPESIKTHIDIIHQMTAGKVKALIYAKPHNFEKVKNRFLPNLPRGAEIEMLGKSISVFFPVQKLDPFCRSFSEQKSAVEEALKLVYELKSMIEKTQADNGWNKFQGLPSG